MACNQFEQEEDYMTPLRVVLQSVLPILDTIQREASDEVHLVSAIKDRWVHLLGEELEGRISRRVLQLITMSVYH